MSSGQSKTSNKLKIKLSRKKSFSNLSNSFANAKSSK